MSYSNRIDQSKQKVYNHAIATKIRDLMGKLRKSSNEDRKRRWIWELLQNAKDAGFSDQGVKAQIDFHYENGKGYLKFMHNGRPFSVDNITFLIEQVSTKDQKAEHGQKPKETGKFGTGFLTTHLLSERADIEGVVKEADEPYKKFNISLDRSAREIDQIIFNVNQALELLNKLDAEPPFESYDKRSHNTAFTYELDATTVEVAKAGMADLDSCLPFTLIFLPQIEAVEALGYTYTLLKAETKSLDEVTIYTVKKEDFLDTQLIKIATLSLNHTTIAVLIDDDTDRISVKKLDKKIPKLFCDFPLIGTEDFAFPIIVNNSLFNPTEPRDGIDLTDVSDVDVLANKKHIGEAVELYYLLLDFASSNSWQNLFLLADISIPKEQDWLSNDWFKKTILMPLRSKLLITPIVDTYRKERVSIVSSDKKENVYFPSGSKDVRDNIWELAKNWLPSKLPAKEHLDDWSKVMWADFPSLDLERITKHIEKQQTTVKVESMLIESNAIVWLSSYFNIVDLEGRLVDKIINNTYAVIPNQKGTLKKKSELFIDDGIEEELKTILGLIDTADPRDYLVHLTVSTGNKIEYAVKKQDDIVSLINQRIKEGGSKNISQACNCLISLFADDAAFPNEREQLFQFCKTVFKDVIPEKKVIATWHKDTWQEADRLEIKWLVDNIASAKNVQLLNERTNFANKVLCIKWLDTFIAFLVKNGYENKLNLKASPILPNQNGAFVIKDDLFLDDGNIDTDLKDIALRLGYDIRAELLDIDVMLDLPENRVRNKGYLAHEITQLVTPKFQEIKRTEDTREIFKSLYLWFQNNKAVAEVIFEDLYKNKHKLYDDEMVVENMEKAEKFSEIMNEFHFSNIEDLRSALANTVQVGSETTEKNGELLPVTKETLASLGITSLEEFEQALEDTQFAESLRHTSDPTVEMFIYAQTLITRAQKNILSYLEKCAEYDCSEYEQIAPTVIAGIKKKGAPIYVVVRPSDNGVVIVYYSSERDILEQDNVELWIDNGISDPQLLTLGKILKKTGINKIPV